MRIHSLVAALAVGTNIVLPITEAQYLPMDAYDSIDISPDIGAPYNDESDSTTNVYIPTAAQTSAVEAMLTAVEAGATTVVNAPRAASSLALSKRGMSKRGTCNPASPGNGPTIHIPNDSVASFMAKNSTISGAAISAVTPLGYVLAAGYMNLNASAESSTYLTYTYDGVTSYDPSVCSAKCDNITGCVSFNIYFERDPSEDPDTVNCPNPPSLTRIKCAFFGSMTTTAEAINFGQDQASFQIAIAGSNAYNKSPTTMTIPGYSGPTVFGNASIMAPSADNSYLSVQVFDQTQPYDPRVCAAACNKTTIYQQSRNSTRVCKFFDAYILYKNGAKGAFICTYYTQSYGATFATNAGQYNDEGDHFTVGSSVGYTSEYKMVPRWLREGRKM